MEDKKDVKKQPTNHALMPGLVCIGLVTLNYFIGVVSYQKESVTDDARLIFYALTFMMLIMTAIGNGVMNIIQKGFQGKEIYVKTKEEDEKKAEPGN